jgi:hypothetical protein
VLLGKQNHLIDQLSLFMVRVLNGDSFSMAWFDILLLLSKAMLT